MDNCEPALVDAFVVPPKRERYRTLLAGRRREKALAQLDHFGDLDDRYSTRLPSNADVRAHLQALGAPDACHLISSDPELDGREMLLQDALHEIEIRMRGTLVGCLPGSLAYYYGENGEQRVVLHRDS